ncbi:MAG: citrate synthase [Candidatus Marinimicrobia bacterium]|nr:citrate synthase [Candidatus Neomarinimicrobiota bacterium]
MNHFTVIEEKYIQSLSRKLKRSCQIKKELYFRYEVKRGLRNEDHTGVLVGLTNIGDVVGYRKTNGQVEPCEGELYYRGYELKDLIAGYLREGRHGFDEICYLLLSGELPDYSELEEFSSLLKNSRTLPDYFIKNLVSNPPGKNLMNSLARAVLDLYPLDEKAEDRSEENVAKQAINLLAKFPTLVAYAYNSYRHIYQKQTLSIRHPREDLTTAENFLYLLKGEKFTPLEAELLDICLSVHAEHGGGNNSTFTVRVTSSAGTDTYSAISSGIASLKGIYHGGANHKVMEMMDHLKFNISNWKDETEIGAYLEKILRKETYDGWGIIYGIGHAIYTKSDPRAVILKEKAAALAEEKNRAEEFDFYTKIEKLAPEVFYRLKGQEKKILCANVDFYSGFIYSCIGIPEELYTPVFAMGRLPGWLSHRLEEVNMSSKRIIRPAYKNVTSRKAYIAASQR